MTPTIELPIGLQRLQQLADHLEHGKLGHEVFDFRQTNNSINASCGAAGCALGECPILFPQDWGWSQAGDAILLNEAFDYHLSSAKKFFQLTGDEARHLFYPCEQDPYRYGGKSLGDDATKEEVAAGIRAFIQKKLAE